MKFHFENLKILNEIIIIKPDSFVDKRGSIFSSFNEKLFNKELKKKLHFVHDKFSYSKKNVLRGLHGDKKSWKLISCLYGNIFQVVVNYDKNSKDYLKHVSFNLNSKEKKMILIPPNYLNGFYVKSNNAIYHYKLAYTGSYFDEDKQFSVKWNDRDIGIIWPTEKPILSKRDK